MENKFAILWPTFALAAWTLCVLLLVATRRLHASLSGKVHPREFALGESQRVPIEISLLNRNYMNLLELPVLFYVACVVSFVTGAASPAIVCLAWLYVFLRVVHSLVHITYNRIIHRFVVFAASNVVLIAIWVVLGRTLAGAA
jgi:hypothetical protein